MAAAIAADHWFLARFHADPLEQAIGVSHKSRPNALKSQSRSSTWQYDINLLWLTDWDETVAVSHDETAV
jgi:hypothetical protein